LLEAAVQELDAQLGPHMVKVRCTVQLVHCCCPLPPLCRGVADTHRSRYTNFQTLTHETLTAKVSCIMCQSVCLCS
jgi:hypothetical protein